MGEWMGTFLAFLSFKNATLMDPDEEDEPGPIEKLQAAIVENVSLYAEKYEEEFAQGPTPFLPGFAQAIWARLIEVGSQTKYDALASSSIKFLTAVVSKAHYSALFSGEGMLSQILTSIVVPNLMLRESDEELFEDNPTEWITKDMEGNDTETRRRCACDLVRGMGKQFEAPTTALCGEQIGAMLASHAGDTSGGTWKAKDCALQLLVAVSAKSSTGAGGVSVTNAAIDVNAMVGTHVMPELAPAAGEWRQGKGADNVQAASHKRVLVIISPPPPFFRSCAPRRLGEQPADLACRLPQVPRHVPQPAAQGVHGSGAADRGGASPQRLTRGGVVRRARGGTVAHG